MDESTAGARLLGSENGGVAPESGKPSKQFPYAPFRKYNHNVVVTWGVTVAMGIAESIWTVRAHHLTASTNSLPAALARRSPAHITLPTASAHQTPRLTGHCAR